MPRQMLKALRLTSAAALITMSAASFAEDPPLLLAPSSSSAEETPTYEPVEDVEGLSREELLTEARKAEEAKAYEHTVSLLERANELEAEPALLFQIASAYERQGEFEAASEHYKRFAASPDITAEEQAEAQKHIDTLTEIMAIQQ